MLVAIITALVADSPSTQKWSNIFEKKNQSNKRARNLCCHKYIYGYNSNFNIAKRTTLYFIAPGNRSVDFPRP